MAAPMGDSRKWRRNYLVGPRSQERLMLKDRILDGISKSIKKIQELHILRGPSSPLVLTNQDWELNKLCEHLDHALLHGLRSVTRGYWMVVREFTHRTSVKEIKMLTNVTTELGRGRSWLFMAMNDGLLESYLHCFESNVKMVKKHYVKEALVLDSERLDILVTLVSGLDFITFDLTYDVTYLDFSCHCPGVDSPDEDKEDRISICSMESSVSQMFDHNNDMAGRARTESMLPFPRSPGHDDLLPVRPRSISSLSSQMSTLQSSTGDFSRGSYIEDEDFGAEEEEGNIEVIHVKSKKKKKKKKGSSHGSSSSTPTTPVTPVTPADAPVFCPISHSNDKIPKPSLQEDSPSHPTQLGPKQGSPLTQLTAVTSPDDDTKGDNSVPQKSHTETTSIVRDSFINSDEPPDLDLIERAILNGPAIRTQPSDTSLHVSDNLQQSTSSTSFNIYDFKNRTSISSQGSSGGSSASVSGLLVGGKDEHALFPRRPSDYNKSDFEVITEEQDPGAAAGAAVDPPSEKHTEDEPKSGKKHEASDLEKADDSNLLSPTDILDGALQTGEKAKTRRENWGRAKTQRARSGAFNENENFNFKVNEKGADVTISLTNTVGQNVQLVGKDSENSKIPSSQLVKERRTSESIYSDKDKLSDSEDKTESMIGHSDGDLDLGLDLSRTEDQHQQETEDTESAEEYIDEEEERVIMRNSEGKSRQLDIRLDNNSKLFLMLEVFQTEDEQFLAMYPTTVGHTEGNTQKVFVMLTSNALYILTPGPGRGKYNKETVVRYQEIDYVDLSVNFQTVHIVCTNRRKQHWITTGDEELTKAMVKSLEEAVRNCEVDLLRLSVLTDATTQKIAMKKWLAQECGVASSEVELLCYSLVSWEDTQSKSRSGLAKEGTLLVKTPNNLYGHTWKAAFFVLRDGILLQFPNKNNTKEPERTIQLGGEDCCGCRRAHVSDRENCFEIILSDNSTIQMSASNESETFDWLQTLCKAVSEGMGKTMLLEGAPGGVGVLPCCAVLTPNKLFMCHEDLQTYFFRTIGSANVLDVTGITIDPTDERYCIVEFESQDRKVSSEQWILYFASTKEQRKFTEALSDAWKRHFQVSIPVNIFEDMTLQWKCKDTLANALAPLSIS
ncbi:pleckstrin homology domain-containing family M member 2-like isoform X1 [Lingula anatina]|uniref:Pleckstrin homology domain-containing family M member 2-like isoform X1 n=1 Tax=Lingula anatina TaxID=7574 RepID=A0A1S3ICY8_LINAN|nr:pleckstrin homology domain-containing family M member 2-like isoform X1 [Lingula anatina]|eukprot:XP_013395304.1 pleckstrin homology domain-containing family M member 2-like isoform X1 [Lingula anatina]